MSKHISADSSSPECFSQARTWLDNCIRNHRSYQYHQPNSSLLPTRVICVGGESTEPYLYETSPGEKGDWAALSYCWGGVKTMTTCIDSLSERKVGIALNELAKTCRDAVLAARALSIPYVWIDSLCIIQDSLEDWEKEAARMCYTYENALITFAAPNSPAATSGLFLPTPQRRTVKIDTSIDGKEVSVYARRELGVGTFSMHTHYDSQNSWGQEILATRGWTLQELALAPRILWFGAAELGWSCWSSTACECDPEPKADRVENGSEDHFTLALRTPSSPDATSIAAAQWQKTWRKLVQDFTLRKLSFGTDRLPAMSGLAAKLENRVDGKYFAGLWESDMSAQLLWVSYIWYDDEADRPSLLKNGYAPSWSWASVAGPIQFARDFQGPRFQLIWNIVATEFRPRTLNPFGPGEGLVTIEGYTLPVRLVRGTLVWVAPPDEKGRVATVAFGDEEVVVMDPRLVTSDETVKEVTFLIAGMTMKRGTGASDVPSICHGIVLESIAGETVFRRLGYAEPRLAVDTTLSAPDERKSWTFWKNLCIVKMTKIM